MEGKSNEMDENGNSYLHLVFQKNSKNNEEERQSIIGQVVDTNPSLFTIKNNSQESVLDLIVKHHPEHIPSVIQLFHFDSSILHLLSSADNPMTSFLAFSKATAQLPQYKVLCMGPPLFDIPKVRWFSSEDRQDAEFYTEYNKIVSRYTPTGIMVSTQDIKNSRFEGKYRIISLDGGGVKALMQLYILQRLEEKFPGFLARTVLFCGVSAGSILSTQLAQGCDVPTAIQLFELVCKYIFIRKTFGGAYGSLYTNKYILKYLEMFYGNKTLNELPRNVFFISVCAKEPRVSSVLFNNFTPECGDIKVVDACMRSSSAPIFFDSYEGYLDGALFENNPVTCAFPMLFGKTGNVNVRPQDVVCLSISTGAPNVPYISQEEYGNAGFLKWAPRTLDLFQYSRRDMSNTIGKELLGERYFRLDPKMPNGLRINSISECEKIIDCGKNIDLTSLEEWVKEYWM
ncbi:hypothetical protein EIN_146350 [Entamoeba invadens IP1]|uniref:PNPLA domain-containing protein n=1 Tax=Entamoeba invadens IP1 TaxID=370355 RepID=L7FL95_ENTIV|nr:hypothetical protein EIN_146350 [Entamoeba invadens IP1]ELP87631.1 hypothetical protein EIN_146350 [Entamoeba invadens IP1]|eukprot:XP_004254402.1 hypothetical protein EIN_146350 [Entamoeba invadens IP1]